MAGLFGTLAAPKRKDAQALDQLPGFLLDAGSKTGISVTWSAALQVTAMFACCRVIGEDLAQSRCRLMRPRARGGMEVATDHPLHRLVFLTPEKGQTAFSFWETIAFIPEWQDFLQRVKAWAAWPSTRWWGHTRMAPPPGR